MTNLIEKHVQEAFAEHEPLTPLTVPTEATPTLGTPSLALTYAGVTLTAFMAGNVITDFVGDEAPTEGSGSDLRGRSGAELLALRTEHIVRR